jgi:hypothetical protein
VADPGIQSIALYDLPRIPPEGPPILGGAYRLKISWHKTYDSGSDGLRWYRLAYRSCCSQGLEFLNKRLYGNPEHGRCHMRIVFALPLVIMVSIAGAEEIGILHLGPLVLQFPAGWTMQGNSSRVEGRGPHEERMIADYYGVKDGVTDPAAQVLGTAREFARVKMPELAQKDGTVLRPVTEQALEGGRTAFSAVTQEKKLFRPRFFLQYLFASTRGWVYITVEGYGEAAPGAASFEKILATQKWMD